jgi:hypothetical protein
VVLPVVRAPFLVHKLQSVLHDIYCSTAGRVKHFTRKAFLRSRFLLATKDFVLASTMLFFVFPFSVG